MLPGRDVERAEPEVIALFVGDHESAAIGEPARGNVRHVLGVAHDLARGAGPRIDQQQILRRVVEDPHHQEPLAVRRPTTHDVPGRARQKGPFGARRDIGDDDVHIRRNPRVARERDERAVGRCRVPRQQPLHATRGICRKREGRSIGVPHVKLMELGTTAVGRRDELAVRAPAEAAHRVPLDRDGALGFSTGGRERPRLVGTRALIGNNREGLSVR